MVLELNQRLMSPSLPRSSASFPRTRTAGDGRPGHHPVHHRQCHAAGARFCTGGTRMYANACVHTHVCTHAHTHAHAHARTRSHARARAHTHTDAMLELILVHARMRARIRTRARTRMHAHAHARTRTHAHARTQTLPPSPTLRLECILSASSNQSKDALKGGREGGLKG
jgi:hypothetical protein